MLRLHPPVLARVMLAASIVAVASCSLAHAQAGPMFRAPGYEYGPGGISFSLAFADLNGDGALDMIVGGENLAGTMGINVAMGRGGGTFGPFVASFPSLRGTVLVAADFDGDGKMDVAGTRFRPAAPIDSVGSVFLACGDGNGGWSSFAEWPTSGAGEYVSASDVNHDGLPDLLVTFGYQDSIGVFLAHADRTLEFKGEYPLLGQGATSITAEVTGDSNPDLIVAEYDSAQVAVFPGNGDGTFGPRVDSPSVRGVYGLGVLDATNGGPRLLGLGVSTGATQALAGPGTFAALDTIPQSDNEGWGALAVGDINGDGKLDYITTNHLFPSAISAHLGDGLGHFGPSIKSRVISGFGDYSTNTLADVNGDGILDAAYACRFTSHMVVAFGNGDGTFGGPPQPAMVPGRLAGVAVGDFDEDGKPDAISVLDGSQVAFAHGNGDATFAPITLSSNVAANVTDLATADLDGDNHLDLVGIASGLSLLKGQGNGAFGAPTTFTTGSSPQAPTVFDLDGDGKLDVIVPCSGGSELDVFLQGAGGLTPASVQTTPTAGPFAVRYADLNHDGAVDRIYSGTSGLVVQLNNGAGGYGPAIVHPLTPVPGDFALADLDEDGFLDAVVAPRTMGSTVMVLRGRPDGTFDSDQSISLAWSPAEPPSPRRVFARDFDGDGHLDLAVLDGGTEGVMVLRGNGDRTFHGEEAYAGGSSTSSTRIAIADMDGDGRLDIVGTDSQTSGTVGSTFYQMRNASGGVTAVGPPPVVPGTHAALALSRVAPNPSTGRFAFTLTAAHPGEARLALYSPAGREVYARAGVALVAGANRITLDASPGALRAGVYWLRASVGAVHATGKVVVFGR